MQDDEKDFRDSVAEAYAKVLEFAKTQQSGCCGGPVNPCAEGVNSVPGHDSP